MAVQLTDDILARHPEWGTALNPSPTDPTQATPIPMANTMPTPGGSTATGTIPITTNQLPYPAQSPAITGGDPNQAIWEATQNALAAKSRDISINQAYNALQPQAFAATNDELGARTQKMEADKAYLSELTRANDASHARTQQMQDAEGNVDNITKVAAAQHQRDSLSYIYRLGGMSAPIEVSLPIGYKGQLPPGVTSKIETLADKLKPVMAKAEEAEKYYVEAARIHSDNVGMLVTAAQIRSGKVNLTLDEAGLALKASGLDVDRANVALEAAKQAPIPGYVWDETTDSWTTSSQASLNQSLKEEAMRNAALGPYGSTPIDTLMSMASANPQVLSDEELRQALAAHNISSSLIEKYVQLASARRTSASNNIGNQLDALVAAQKAKQGNPNSTTEGDTLPALR